MNRFSHNSKLNNFPSYVCNIERSNWQIARKLAQPQALLVSVEVVTKILHSGPRIERARLQRAICEQYMA